MVAIGFGNVSRSERNIMFFEAALHIFSSSSPALLPTDRTPRNLVGLIYFKGLYSGPVM